MVSQSEPIQGRIPCANFFACFWTCFNALFGRKIIAAILRRWIYKYLFTGCNKTLCSDLRWT